jgi:NADPH2:quinone reductase
MSTPRIAEPRVQAVPTTMRAAAIDQFGPPKVLTLHTLPTPKPGSGEVLIAMHAAGVGVWDAEARKGSYASGRARFPLVLGTDGAGVVVDRGSRVRRHDVDDRVWAYEFSNPKGGFYAEYVAVNAERVGRVPRRLNLLQAGAAAVTGLTALQGVDDHLQVKEDKTVLIFGAAGAVGTLAVQFAKRLHARVIGVIRGRDAADLLLELGADAAIDSTSGDIVRQLAAAAPDGLDAVLALAGGKTLEACLDVVRDGGRVAYPNGVEPELESRAGMRVVSYDAVAGPREFAELEEAVEEAHLQVPLAGVFSLERAAEAHAQLEGGHVLGRIVLRISGEQD